MTTKLYKDGDQMAITTDAKDERQFSEQFSVALSNMIEQGCFQYDWEFQLDRWLPQYMDICCHYRGYKSGVAQRLHLTAGSMSPSGLPYCDVDERAGVLIAGQPTTWQQERDPAYMDPGVEEFKKNNGDAE